MSLTASRRRKVEIEPGYPIQDGQTAAVRTKCPLIVEADDPVRLHREVGDSEPYRTGRQQDTGVSHADAELYPNSWPARKIPPELRQIR